MAPPAGWRVFLGLRSFTCCSEFPATATCSTKCNRESRLCKKTNAHQRPFFSTRLHAYTFQIPLITQKALLAESYIHVIH